METIAKINSLTASIETARTKSKSPSTFWENAEINRFGIAPLLLVFIVCVSSAAAAVSLQQSDIQLACVIFTTAITLAMVLAVMPMRLIVACCSITLLTDLLVFIF